MAALTPTAKASLFSVVVPADLSAGEYYFTIKAEGHHDKPRKDPQYPVQVLFFCMAVRTGLDFFSIEETAN